MHILMSAIKLTLHIGDYFMKVHANFFDEFDAEDEISDCDSPALDEKQLHKLELIKKLGAMKNSQYKRTKSEKLTKLWTDIIYPYVRQIAEVQNGNVTFEVDENTLVGKLSYCGRNLIINNIFCEALDVFRLMTAYADDIYIEPEDNTVKLLFIFHLYEEEKITDHYAEIKQLESQLFSKKYFENFLHRQ